MVLVWDTMNIEVCLQKAGSWREWEVREGRRDGRLGGRGLNIVEGRLDFSLGGRVRCIEKAFSQVDLERKIG